MTKKRDMGIELIRVVSMLMIILLHCLGYGGIYQNALGLTKHAANLLRGLICCNVNLFALCSGYVFFGKKQRWSRLAELWIQVLCYSVAGLFLVCLLKGSRPEGSEILYALFPVTGNQYWYFSCYFCLFCLRPFVDKMLNGLSKRHFRALLLMGLVLFCGIGAALKDVFLMNVGYSPWWLLFLYCVGSYLRAYPEDFQRKRWVYLLAYFLFSGAALLLEYAVKQTAKRLPILDLFSNSFVQYNSPLILAAAVSLFLALAGLEISKGGKLLGLLSAVSFDVYLIHVHPAVFIELRESLTALASVPWYEMLGCVLGITLGVYVLCAGIGWLRIGVFRLLHIKQLSTWIAEKIQKVFSRVLNGKQKVKNKK